MRSGICLLVIILSLACMFIIPVSAFTANSLDITVSKNGDATAIFRFTLDGVIENAIPQSMLEEQLMRGLTTGSEPPILVAVDRTSATLLMKNFADVHEVPTGTEYRTASMDFKKAEIALQNTGLSSVISADFSPQTTTLSFPDSYSRKFLSVDALPSVTHVVIDPTRAASGSQTSTTGRVAVTSTPSGAEVYIDSSFVGNTPGEFTDITPGTHTVSVQKPGFDASERTIIVHAGETSHLTIPLSYSTSNPETGSSGFPFLLVFGGVLALVSIAAGYYILRKRPD